jgi:hypothetical protein
MKCRARRGETHIAMGAQSVAWEGCKAMGEAAASRSASLREEAEPPPGVRLLALSRCRKPSPLPPCSCKG